MAQVAKLHTEGMHSKQVANSSDSLYHLYYINIWYQSNKLFLKGYNNNYAAY